MTTGRWGYGHGTDSIPAYGSAANVPLTASSIARNPLGILPGGQGEGYFMFSGLAVLRLPSGAPKCRRSLCSPRPTASTASSLTGPLAKRWAGASVLGNTTNRPLDRSRPTQAWIPIALRRRLVSA